MTRFFCVLALLALLSGGGAQAHDLAQASATLTVRDAGVVELTLAVPYEEVLHQQVMARQPLQAFLVAFASAPPPQTAAAVDALHATLARRTRLVVDGRPTALDRWTWPSAAAVRDTLRQALMMGVTGAREHPERLRITATARIPAAAGQVQLELPEALGPTLVTVNHPQERWVAAGATSGPFSLR